MKPRQVGSNYKTLCKMKKFQNFILAKTEDDVYAFLGQNRTPIIKICDGKIIEPKEINLCGLSLIDWLKQNEDELTYLHNPLFSKEGLKLEKYYNPNWKLYELKLDKHEDFSIIEKIDEKDSQFYSDLRQFNILQKNLEQVFNFIEPNEQNKQVYGLELRNIILLSSMEVEVHWQNLMKNNGYKKNRLTTKDYFKLNEFINFKFEFKISNHPNFGTIKPFDDWVEISPTNSLKWYNSYNKIKHDRSNNLNMATLELAIASVSAVLTLLIVRYGQSNIDKAISTNLFSTTKSVRISKYSLGFHLYNDKIKYKKYFIEE